MAICWLICFRDTNESMGLRKSMHFALVQIEGCTMHLMRRNLGADGCRDSSANGLRGVRSINFWQVPMMQILERRH